MKLQELGEFGFIERVQKSATFDPGRVLQGIGDDCAVLPGAAGEVLLFTTDALVENVHFLRRRAWMEQLGRKSLAVNVSDIAAMGGVPGAAVVSLAVPQEIAVEEMDAFYRGFNNLAAEYRVDVVGGDTTGSRDGLFISVALTGRAAADRVLYRHGAQPGDCLYTTGPLGDSAAGLALILKQHRAAPAAADYLLQRHLDPTPRLQEGIFLAASGAVTAMIDVSDGLAGDLGHLCRRSRCGARLEAERIPLAAHNLSLNGEAAALDRALHGGEDYELLLAVTPSAAARLEESYERAFSRPLFRLGQMTAEGGLRLRQGHSERLIAAAAYDHFKTAEK